ncbi:MAG: DUF6544 family protein [Bacteroidales bacterium]
MKILVILSVVITLLIFFILIKTISFRQSYISDVRSGLARISDMKPGVLAEDDIADLPAPVQKYIRYTGVINREKVISGRFYFEGTMQEKGKPEFRIRAEQTSLFDIPTRLFYIKGNLKGIPVTALHKYHNANATFEVKPLSLFHAVNMKGGSLNIAETVTFLNDMCLLAPATLIDKRLSWEIIDSMSVRVTLRIDEVSVSALLLFNENGELINFVSDDRYYLDSSGQMHKVKWSTPVINYGDFGGYRLPSYAEAVWSLPDGEFTYAKYYLRGIRYNLTE